MQHAHSAAGRLSIGRGRGLSPQGRNSAIRQPIRFSPRVTLRLGRAAFETDATGGGDRGGHLLLRLRTAHEVLRAAHPGAAEAFAGHAGVELDSGEQSRAVRDVAWRVDRGDVGAVDLEVPIRVAPQSQ